MEYGGAPDAITFSNWVLEKVDEEVNKHFKTKSGAIKVYISCVTEFENMSGSEVFKHCVTSMSVPILSVSDLTEMLPILHQSITSKIESMQETGSGCIIKSIIDPCISILKYSQFKVGKFTPTPKRLAKKRCIINIPTEGIHDGYCFQYSILAHLNKTSRPTNSKRVASYRKLLEDTDIDFSMCSTPLQMSELDKFENINQMNVNIFSLEGDSIVNPFRLPKIKRTEVVNLLLLKQDVKESDEEEETFHIALITNLDRLLNVHSSNSSNHSYTFCPYCLSGFDKRYNGSMKLEEHRSWCNGTLYPAARVIYPSCDRKYIGFNKFQSTLYNPLVLYADFEAFQETEEVTDLRNTDKREILTEHKASGFAIVPVLHKDIDAELEASYYTGENAMERFFDELERIDEEYNEIFESHCKTKMKKLTQAQLEKFWSEKKCHFCNNSFIDGPPSYVTNPGVGTSKNKYNIVGETDVFDDEMVKYFNDPNQREPLRARKEGSMPPGERVQDHCHITGDFRGAAHYQCNLRAQVRQEVPIFFHNLSKYDSHFILQAVGKRQYVSNFNVIAKTVERFAGFSFKLKHTKFIFRDSLQHLTSSLDSLSTNLLKSCDDEHNLLINTKKLFKTYQEDGVSDEAFNLLTRKGVYPYSFITSLEVLEQPSLPGIEHFFNDLSQKPCSQEDYHHAQEVFKSFKCTSLKDYSNLYMRLDTALLADNFQNYRNLAITKYGLDPSHYYTSPSLSWDACLKTTRQRIELVTDPEMTAFIDRGFLGGVSFARNPHLKANNPLCPDFKPQDPQTWMLLLDANNLYGHAMSQPLPHGGFEWDGREWSEEDILQLEDDSETGYMFEVTLTYPQSLHDKHSQYPLAPEHMIIDDTLLSDWQLQKKKEYKLSNNKSAKLCLTLSKKPNYVVHYVNLKRYLKLGMKIEKVHKTLQFKQSPWMKPYIEINTKIRQENGDSCTKQLAKLMNNSCFGKTCEDVWKYKEVHIFTGQERIKKLQRKINSPFFKSVKIYDEYMAAVLMKKQKVILNKPRYIGQSILSLSKNVMTDFHYNVMLKYFTHDQIKLGFTDTDSFCYQLESRENIYEKMKRIDEVENIFDFSNYPKSHPNYNSRNYLTPGKFKDEGAGVPFCDGIFLRSKMYSLVSVDDKLSKLTAKGIDSCTKNRELTHQRYVDSLYKDTQDILSSTRIINNRHKIYTVTQKKAGLSNFNDKIWLSQNPDGSFDAQPFGYKQNL